MISDDDLRYSEQRLLLGGILALEVAMSREEERLVTVLTVGDGGQIAHASSILEEAGIPYFEKGGISHRLGIYLFNASARFVEIQVRAVDIPAARKALIEGGMKPD